jgi:hypothetical protein
MPFYTFGGSLSLQANGQPVTGVATLNFTNGLIGVAGSVANFTAPGVVLTNGILTIEDPVSINLAGTAVLTQQSVEPEILQQSALQSGDGSITCTLTNVPAVGSLMLAIFWGAGVYEGTALAGWSKIFFESSGYQNIVGFTKTSAGAADQSVQPNFGNIGTGFLFEIGEAGTVSYVTSPPVSMGEEYSFPAQAFSVGSLVFTVAVTNVSETGEFSTPLPNGSTLIASYSDRNQLIGLLMESVVASSPYTAGISLSVTQNCSYAQVAIAANAANVSATITT